MVFDSDTDYETEIICPWCGCKHDETWEFEDGSQDCGDCGREFTLIIFETVRYSTTKIEPKNDDVTGQ